MRVCFLDLETTGLDSEVEQITEAAWITQDLSGEWHERQFFVEHDRLPNRWVLENTDYLTRILPAPKVSLHSVLEELARNVAGRIDYEHIENTAGFLQIKVPPVHIAGCCPSFDDRFLRKAFLSERVRAWDAEKYRYSQLTEPPYHYHLIDVEAMAFAVSGLECMPRLKDLRDALGIPGENDAPHSALADAREAKLIYETILAMRPTRAETLLTKP